MIQVKDYSDKGGKQGKTFRYEVGMYFTELEVKNEVYSSEIIIAKFKYYADALYFAETMAKNPNQGGILSINIYS